MNQQELLNQIRDFKFSGDTVTLHAQLCGIIMRSIVPQWEQDIHPEGKQAYYLSFEYLIGRMIFNNLMNLGILEKTNGFLKCKGIDIRVLEDIEDAALGNGGLGRLAACYLESAATTNLPLSGYGIRYKYGLFKQVFQDGFQTEIADDWQKYGDSFGVRRDDVRETVVCSFGSVTAIAYDMPVIGYGCKRIGLLRLWQAEGENADKLCDYLYPDDSNDEGKKLRIMQEYFLSSASVQNVVRKHTNSYGKDFDRFTDCSIFQLNDTHPVFAVPEFIRVLTQVYGMRFTKALDIAKKSFAYTNHTIMSEALETWDLDMVGGLLPDIVKIIKKIDIISRREFAKKLSPCEAEDVCIIQGSRIHMARLAVYVCNCVNGVAEIHTDILKDDVFKTYNRHYPGKIQNKTNGITQRRWLGLANPLLAAFITEKIGERWMTDLNLLAELNQKAADTSSIAAINDIKRQNKIKLAGYLQKYENIRVDADTLFDVQIKRLHEYKRQLMNALSILYLYFGIKDGSIQNFYPTTYLFGAKAAGSYFRAKGIIKFIHEIAKMINNDTSVNQTINVVFVPNYNVSWAERIVAAAEVSEQISLAGTEASGTGNMKFMLNGAVTLGTLDGANVEIVRFAGAENNYIFGLNRQQVAKASKSYSSIRYLCDEPQIKRLVDTLIDGTFDDGGTGHFADIYRALTTENDRYMALADLKSYIEAKLAISRDYTDRQAFGAKALHNISGAGFFSSDRAVSQYAKDIWKIGKE